MSSFGDFGDGALTPQPSPAPQPGRAPAAAPDPSPPPGEIRVPVGNRGHYICLEGVQYEEGGCQFVPAAEDSRAPNVQTPPVPPSANNRTRTPRRSSQPPQSTTQQQPNQPSTQQQQNPGAAVNDYRNDPNFLEAERRVQACEESAAAAESGCMTERNSDVTAIANLTDQATQAIGTVSIADACATNSRALQAASAAVLAVKGQCTIRVQSCNSSCRSASEAIREAPQAGQAELRSMLNTPNRQCQMAQQRIIGMERQIAHLVQSQTASDQCQQNVTVAQNPNTMPSLEQCRANPMLSGCQIVLGQDCLNPQFAQNNPICANCAANPQDPRCLNANAARSNATSSSRMGSGPGTDNSGQSDPLGSGVGLGGGASGQADLASIEGSQRSGLSQGQQAGGSPPQGGGGQRANRQRGGAQGFGSTGQKTQVNRGFIGGGNAAAAGGIQNPGSTYEGWLAGFPPDPRFIGKNGVDLRQFLPRDGQRFGIDDSVRITGPDGITAPNVSNFVKVRRRYQALMHTFDTRPPTDPNWQPPQYLEAISYGLPPGSRVPPGPLKLPLMAQPRP